MEIAKKLSCMVIVAALGANSSFAAGTALTFSETELQNKALSYSLTVQQLKDGVKSLEEGYVSAVEGASSAGQMLYDYENYKAMYESGRGSQTENRQIFAIYQAMFGQTPSISNEELYEKFGKSAEMADEGVYYQLQSTKLDLKSLEATLQNSVSQIIYGIASTSSGIKLQESALKLGQKQLVDLKAKFEQGKASSYEVTKQMLSVQKSTLQLEKTKRSLVTLERQLKNLTGITNTEPMSLSYPLTPKPASQIKTLAEYKAQAIEQRNEVLKAKYTYEEKKKGLEVAQKYLKNVDLISYKTVENEFRLAEAEYMNQIHAVNQDVLGAFNALTSAKVQLELLSQKLSDSKLQLDNTKAFFSSGLVNEATVMSAELDYLNQTMNYQNGIFEYNKAYDTLTIKSEIGLQSGGK